LYRRPEEALQHFSIARALRPGSTVAQLGLAYAFRSMARRDPERRDEYLARARERINFLRQRSPDDAYFFDLLREIAEDAQDHQAVVALSREALRLNPDSTNRLVTLAHDLIKAGARDEADEQLKQVIEKQGVRLAKDRDNASLHLELGSCWELRWKNQKNNVDAYDSAIRHYRMAIELQPLQIHPYNLLGDALKEKGDHTGGIELFQQMVKRMPNEPWAYYRLGRCYEDNRNDSQAAENYRRTIEIGTSDHTGHIHMATFFDRVNETETAISEARIAIRLNPYDSYYTYILGVALFDDGQTDEAEQVLRNAIRFKPVWHGVHHTLGQVLYYQSRYGEAIAEFQQDIAGDPADHHAHFHLGKAFEAAGQFSEALAEFTRAIDLSSKDPDARTEYSKALADCRKLLELNTNRIPALLRGDLKSKDAAEGIELAELAYYTKHYPLSAQLYANALKSDPKRAEDLEHGARYNAACAAALAGCGSGSDSSLPDDAAKAEFRKQARAYLRADLAAWSKLVEADAAKNRREARQNLRHWKHDRDIAGIRDQTALAKLSDDERGACQALWADVDKLLAKCITSPNK
jgi:tetratricopeptide (TPR) repeat protein